MNDQIREMFRGINEMVGAQIWIDVLLAFWLLVLSLLVWRITSTLNALFARRDELVRRFSDGRSDELRDELVNSLADSGSRRNEEGDGGS